MNRPNIDDYYLNDDSYMIDLEEYCDELESRLEYYKSITGMHLKDSISVMAEDVSAKRWWQD